MMQNPALQDKLCLKFLLVIVPGVFAHMLRDWSRSKQPGTPVLQHRLSYIVKAMNEVQQDSGENADSSHITVGQPGLRPYRLPTQPTQLSLPSSGIRSKLQVVGRSCHTSSPACLLPAEVASPIVRLHSSQISKRPLHRALDMPGPITLFIFKTPERLFFCEVFSN